MPLLLVGADMVSDGDVLGQMWSYTFMAKEMSGGGNISRSDEALNEERNMTVNDTAVTNSTASEQKDLTQGAMLLSLFFVSIAILVSSTLNMLRSNPLASLVRNARTTVMMNSRELERKDVPVPLGNS